MKEPAHGYGLYIKKISDAMAKRANRSLQAHNLTLSQSHMLMSLAAAEEKTHSLKELEAHFRVAQSTMAGLVARLERKGMLETLSDPEDRRIKRVQLTQVGLKTSQACRADIRQTEETLVAGLNEEEKALLMDMLRRVYASLNDAEGKDDLPVCLKP